MKRAVSTAKAPQALGPYSQAVWAGDTLYLSGQIPMNPDGSLVTGDVRNQLERVFLNLSAVLEAAGLGFEHVVKTTAYLASLGDFPALNEAYARHFKPPYPPRTTIEVKALPKGVAVEIDVTAVRADAA